MSWTDHLLHGATVVLPDILKLEAGRYFAVAGFFALVTWLFWRRWFAARKIQARVAARSDYARELIASLRTILIFSLTGLGLYVAYRSGWLSVHNGFAERGPVYFGVTLVAMVLAHDAYFYWTHRAMHHPRLFRAFHWTHHRSKTPTPWTAYAFDAPEAMLTAAFVPLWVAIVPMHEGAIYAFMTWQIVRNVMGHAGVELSPVTGRRSRLWGWLNTTTHHDLHHQSGRYNYGLYFSWWDRWMGTEHPDYQARVAEVAERSRATRRRRVAPVVSAVVIIAGLGLLVQQARAQPNGIAGRWYTRDAGSIVEFAPCNAKPGSWCGRIIWLRQPNDAAGRPRLDIRNPDRRMRNRSLTGIEIVRGLRASGPGAWSGATLYNPDDGRSYSGSIRLEGGN
jgi:Delta7-sterol 5-desaturase